MGLWAALIDRVAGMLAYFPPKPPTYTITSSEGGKYTLSGGFTRDLSRCKVMKLDTERRRGGGGGEKIVAIYVPYDTGNGVGAKKTLLHSHGNAVDLGIMQSVYVHLSETLGVNVLGYGEFERSEVGSPPCALSGLTTPYRKRSTLSLLLQTTVDTVEARVLRRSGTPLQTSGRAGATWWTTEK